MLRASVHRTGFNEIKSTENLEPLRPGLASLQGYEGRRKKYNSLCSGQYSNWLPTEWHKHYRWGHLASPSLPTAVFTFSNQQRSYTIPKRLSPETHGNYFCGER
jgi:hypothetical protein